MSSASLREVAHATRGAMGRLVPERTEQALQQGRDPRLLRPLPPASLDVVTEMAADAASAQLEAEQNRSPRARLAARRAAAQHDKLREAGTSPMSSGRWGSPAPAEGKRQWPQPGPELAPAEAFRQAEDEHDTLVPASPFCASTRRVAALARTRPGRCPASGSRCGQGSTSPPRPAWT